MEEKRNILEGKLPPPIGTSDWATFSRNRYCVDKTLFIKDIVDSKTEVALFTRPRRFGKTTLMRMVRAFFEKMPEDTSYLFVDKKIWAAGEEYRALQGKFPVIYLTFKDIKGTTWASTVGKLIREIGTEVSRHLDAVQSAWGSKASQAQLQRIEAQTASLDEVADALKLLSQALHFYHGIKPLILMDEYDQPISSASIHGYYDEMVDFMRTFLSGALKDNDHCEMGLMTGILRVAKEGIFSGLNNVSVWTVFQKPFREYFGFTEEEVREMATYYGVPEKMDEIKAWYDGYNFGGQEMYNPWSVLSYFRNECTAGAYWLSTSSNDLIKEIIQTNPHGFHERIEEILLTGSTYVQMSEDLGPYSEIVSSPDTLYTLLVSSGYLKIASEMNRGLYAVTLPNKELSLVFEKDIKAKLNKSLKSGVSPIDQAIIKADPVALQKAITSFLLESVSYFDTASEGFYHGLTLGFLAILRDRFKVESNVESGEGRLDIALTPRDTEYPGFIIEVKSAKAKQTALENLAQEAMEQILEKAYYVKMAAEMEALGSTQPIVKIGLAYWKKNCAIAQAE